MYGQIISFLFVLLIIYYVVMILLDIQKAKAVKAAELEKNREEEIDISDEANTFRPTLIAREDPNRPQTSISMGEDETKPENDSGESVVQETNDKKPYIDKASESESAEIRQRIKYEQEKLSMESADDSDFNENKKPEIRPSVSQEPEHTEKRAVEKPFRREGYREPLMTDGLEVGRFLEEAEILAATGKGSLANTVYEIHQ